MANDKDRLWIVTELFPPDETSTSYIMGKIANAMVQKYSVGVICGPKVYDKRRIIDENNKFKLDKSIELYRAKGTGLDKNLTLGKAMSLVTMSKRIMALVRKNVHQGDKVLMVTNPAPLVVMISRFKKKVDFELNILVHDIFPENTIPAGIKLPLYRLTKRLFDNAYARADQLIALGRDMAKVLENKVKTAKAGHPRISIIENWADTNGITPQPFPKDKIILQYAGNIGRVQALDKVINKLSPGIELHIYGTGALEDRLKNMHNPQVFFYGPYLRSQQNEVLGHCTIALVSLHEGMYGLGTPSKAYNILASGRPILFLGPKDSEIDLMVKENGIGYCEWPSIWDLDKLTAMGARARNVAERKYSEDIILQKFCDVI